MRGENSTQGHMFTYLSPEQRIPKDHLLRPIKESADQVLKQSEASGEMLYRNGSSAASPLLQPAEQILRPGG